MKLENKNPNYCASIVRVHTLLDLEGLDRLKGYPAFGFQALIDANTHVGELGVLFTAETQLSKEFCSENNLYRKAEYGNKDPEKTGYIESSGRVKALKLRGNMSTALFMPISSLSYLGVNPEDFHEGDTFTHINGKEVCRKYVIKEKNEGRANKSRGQVKASRVDKLAFPEHFETEQLWRNIHKINKDDYVIALQKIHGTSARFGHTIVKRKLNWREKIAKFLGCKIQEEEYDVVAGSRRVIKDIKEEKEFNHFYEADLWNEHLERIQHLIPPGFIIYGEIIGWVGDSPIQKNYTYQIPKGKSEFYIYRVCTINSKGQTVDLTHAQVEEWAKLNGLKVVPKIWEGRFEDLDVDKYIDVKYVEDLRLHQCLPLDPESPVDEGLVLRIDGIKPYLLKAKSPIFLGHETKILDEGIEDLETAES